MIYEARPCRWAGQSDTQKDQEHRLSPYRDLPDTSRNLLNPRFKIDVGHLPPKPVSWDWESLKFDLIVRLRMRSSVHPH